MRVEVDTAVTGVLREVEDRDGVSAAPATPRPSVIRRSRSRPLRRHWTYSLFHSHISVRRLLSADAFVDEAGRTHFSRVETVSSIEEHAIGLPRVRRAEPEGSGGTRRWPVRNTRASAFLTADSMSGVSGIFVTVWASSSVTHGSWTRQVAAGLLEQRHDRVLGRREAAVTGVVLEGDAQHRDLAGLDRLALIGEELVEQPVGVAGHRVVDGPRRPRHLQTPTRGTRPDG